jgi:Ca-activated chloride channel family protein
MRAISAIWVVGFLAAACASGAGAPARPVASAGPVARPGPDGSAAPLEVAADPKPVEPTGDAAGAWLGAAGESEFVLNGAGEHRVGVWVDVPATSDRPHVPTAVVLTIDTSGSMQGDKIRRAREAAKAVVDRLYDGDFVSVHAFDDVAREIVPPIALSAENRRRVHATISELGANGATNLFDGLQLAEQRMRGAPATHPVRRIIVVSDGKPTVGQSSAEVLGALAARATQAGAQVTSFGVGLDYDEHVLNQLAVRSSGRLYHLADAAELPSIVKSEMDLVQATMATEAVVEIVAADGVELIGVDGLPSERRMGALRVPLGSLFGGQKRELLVRTRISEPLEGRRALASVRLHYEDPAERGLARVQEVVVRAAGTGDPATVAEHRHPRVREIASLHQVAEWTTLAARELSEGKFDDADRRLAQAEAELRSSADKAKGEERVRFEQAARKVAGARKAGKAAAAAPAAARPGAARASSLEANDAAMDAMGF